MSARNYNTAGRLKPGSPAKEPGVDTRSHSGSIPGAA